MLPRIGVACFAAAPGATPALADPVADCSPARKPELRIMACSELVERAATRKRQDPEGRALIFRRHASAYPPKFTLSGEQIDTIIAYINSLPLGD